MAYGDPYSNINSIVGQGYQQDAAIRGQGNQEASALTQHFMDAFMKQRQMDMENKRLAQMQAHQQAMENAALMRQHGMDTNKVQDDWNTYGTEEQVPQFEARARALGVSSPVPAQQFKQGPSTFGPGAIDPNAPSNHATIDLGSQTPVDDPLAGPSGATPTDVQLLPGAIETPGAKTAIPRQGVLFQMKQNAAAAKSAADNVRSQASIMKAQAYADAEPSRKEVNLARAQQLQSLADEIETGRIPLEQARTALVNTQNQWAPTNYAAQNAQRYASAANAGASAGFTSAKTAAGIPQKTADYLEAGTDLRGSQQDKVDATLENPAPTVLKDGTQRHDGAIYRKGNSAMPMGWYKKNPRTGKWALEGSR